MKTEKQNNILLGQPFPNPPMADGRVYLACAGEVRRPVNVQVWSESDKLVYQFTHCLPNHGGTMEMNLPPLPPGRYRMLVRSGTFSGSRELVFPQAKKETLWGRLGAWLFRHSEVMFLWKAGGYFGHAKKRKMI